MLTTTKPGYRGGVSPTLNAFDNTGDQRATILILDGTRVNDVRVYEEPVQTLKERMGTGGNNVPIIFSHTQGLSAQPSDVASPTLRTEGNGMAIATGEDNMQVRRLTPTECERLMGWPDNHTLHRADGKQNSDTTRYKMCGNGVATPVAKWIGEQLVGIHTQTP
jgi:site-specific DNA-cytosine methylase